MEHFKLADIFLAGLNRAKEYGLEIEFIQWTLDELANKSDQMYDGQKEEDVRDAVQYALYEWDL